MIRALQAVKLYPLTFPGCTTYFNYIKDSAEDVYEVHVEADNTLKSLIYGKDDQKLADICAALNLLIR